MPNPEAIRLRHMREAATPALELDKEMEYLPRAESLGSGMGHDHALRGGL
jgi:hypothetical protein